MNPRIQELVSQAKPLDENGQKVRGLNSEFHDQWMEKFAELIVRECSLVCLEDKDSQRILQHFGVEQ